MIKCMKYLAALLSAFLLLAISLVGCGTSNNATDGNAELKDGNYTISYDSVDTHGWRAFLNMTVESGKISNVEYNYYNDEGGLKTDSDEYTKDDVARLVIEAFPVLEQELIETQNPAEVDAVTNATVSSSIFKGFASELYEAAKRGDSREIIVEQTDVVQ